MVATAVTSPVGIVAIAAAAVAVIALLFAAALAAKLRGVRRAQKVLLGEGGERDLAAHAATLQIAFEELEGYVGDLARALEQRLGDVEASLLRTISYHGLVHYDAYNELSGKQSMSIALLDATRSGIVLTCIHHRDQARVYAKLVRDGLAEQQLSPEEADAVHRAISQPALAEDVREPAR